MTTIYNGLSELGRGDIGEAFVTGFTTAGTVNLISGDDITGVTFRPIFGGSSVLLPVFAGVVGGIANLGYAAHLKGKEKREQVGTYKTLGTAILSQIVGLHILTAIVMPWSSYSTVLLSNPTSGEGAGRVGWKLMGGFAVGGWLGHQIGQYLRDDYVAGEDYFYA